MRAISLGEMARSRNVKRFCFFGSGYAFCVDGCVRGWGSSCDLGGMGLDASEGLEASDDEDKIRAALGL